MASPKSYSGVIGLCGKLPPNLAAELKDTTFTAVFARLDFNENPPSANIHFDGFDGTGKELVILNLPRDVGVAFSAWYTSGKNTWIVYVTNVRFTDYYYSADYVRVTFGV